MSIEQLSTVWPEWKVAGQIGEGSFGKVYKVVHEEYGVTSYAAVKVISIPQSAAEVASLRADGYDDKSSRSYFESIVNDFVNEIKMMLSMKGAANIVSVEDYKVIEKTGEIGWDIFIRMELLTSFIDYSTDKKLSEAEVVKLGQDVCSALELCAKRNIIHRDIKPENIFVSSFGDFKVGDFGIARELEKTGGAMSSKGTYNYVAPEVVSSKKYDATVDIYSLGLVLYKLMNNNRLPLNDPYAQHILYQDRKEATDRRLSGEALPPPVEASPHMAQLILMACAYDPAKRFKTATSFKNALGEVGTQKYEGPRLAAANSDTPVAVYGTPPGVQGRGGKGAMDPSRASAYNSGETALLYDASQERNGGAGGGAYAQPGNRYAPVASDANATIVGRKSPDAAERAGYRPVQVSAPPGVEKQNTPGKQGAAGKRNKLVPVIVIACVVIVAAMFIISSMLNGRNAEQAGSDDSTLSSQSTSLDTNSPDDSSTPSGGLTSPDSIESGSGSAGGESAVPEGVDAPPDISPSTNSGGGPSGGWELPTVGDTMYFGEYDWMVLDIQDNKALLLSEDIIELRAYHNAYEAVTWESSDLRKYLNGEFYYRFSAEDRARIAETHVTNNDNQWYGTNGGNDTNDRIFLLSLEEVVRYFGDSGALWGAKLELPWFSDEYDSKRIARIKEDYNGWEVLGIDSAEWDDILGDGTWLWWLRSPGGYNNYAAYVYVGSVEVNGGGVIGNICGVRPALWLNFES